jgi:hypothetical protein
MSPPKTYKTVPRINFKIWPKGALEMECLSLWGSVKETWREGSLSGDPEGYLEKALEMGISLHRGSASGEPGGLVYWGLWELDERALGMGYRCRKRLRRGGLGEGSLPGNLKDEVFEKYANVLQAGLHLYRGPFGQPRGDSFAGTWEK